MLHLKEHTNTKVGKCAKCGGQSTKDNLYRHIIDCHGFGLYQCAHCRFGTNTFEIMSNHLANMHPSKLAMFCERVVAVKPLKGPEPPTDSVRSIRLRTVTGYIEPSWKIRPVFSDGNEQLKNQNLTGVLGPNIIVKPKEMPSYNFKLKPLTKIPEKTYRIPALVDVSKESYQVSQTAGGSHIARLLERPSTEPVRRSVPIVYQTGQTTILNGNKTAVLCPSSNTSSISKPTTSSGVNPLASVFMNTNFNAKFKPQTDKERIVYDSVVKRRMPQLAQLIRKKSAFDIPMKPMESEQQQTLPTVENVITKLLPNTTEATSGLMISDVYSLSDKKQ